MMSHASQGDCAGKASRPATNDDKADLKSCLLRGFMSTPLKDKIRYTEREARRERKTYGVRKYWAFVHDGGERGEEDEARTKRGDVKEKGPSGTQQ
jgi:hypothetical protein